jgi:hypothetical protein
MDIKYCGKTCPIGIEKIQKLLEDHNSIFEAASAFRVFTAECFKNCKYKDRHLKDKQK